MDLIRIYMTIFLLCFMDVTSGKTNRFYTMPSKMCGVTKPKEIDGAVITGSSSGASLYSHSACVMKFMSSDSIFSTKRIRFRVESLNLPCSSVLKVYDNSGTTGSPLARFSCNSNVNSSVGHNYIFRTTQRYLSLRLENAGSIAYSFKIVLTTVRSSGSCDEFRCNNNNCIDKDLRCDGVDHCFDGTDESSSGAYCFTNRRKNGGSIYYSFSGGSIAGLIVSVVVLIIIATVISVVCRRRRMQMTRHRQQHSNIVYAPTTTTVPPPGSYPAQPPHQPGGYAPVPTSYPEPGQPAGYAPVIGAPVPGYPQAPGLGYPPQPGYPQQPPVSGPPPAYYPPQAPGYPPPGEYKQ